MVHSKKVVTDGPTDRPTDGRTDTLSYRDGWTHLKSALASYASLADDVLKSCFAILLSSDFILLNYGRKSVCHLLRTN